MKELGRYSSLAKSICEDGKAQKAIEKIIQVKPNKYMFYSGVFVSIASTIILETIKLSLKIENISYILLHCLLICLSFVATIILAYIADIAEKVNVSAAKEYCRILFNDSLLDEKQNEFENSLKDAFNICDDMDNKKLCKALKRVYCFRKICFIIMPICIVIILIFAILNNFIPNSFIL